MTSPRRINASRPVVTVLVLACLVMLVIFTGSSSGREAFRVGTGTRQPESPSGGNSGVLGAAPSGHTPAASGRAQPARLFARELHAVPATPGSRLALSAAPYAAAFASYEGYLDSAGCDKIYGWAWDQTLPNSAISVDILDGNSFLQRVTAGGFRSDLPGNKFHAFDYVTPNTLKDGRTHFIYARFSGTNTFLTNSPKSLTCAPPPPTISGYSWNTTPTSNQPFGGSVSGSGFISGGTQVFFCQTGTSTCFQHPSAGVSVNSLTSLSLSSVNLSAGSWQFYVQTSSGQSGRSSSFNVQALAMPPSVTGYSWNSTPMANQPFGGTVTGTGFASGIRVFFCQTGTGTCFEHPSAGIAINSSTSLSLSNVNLAGGSWQFYVQTSAGQSGRSSSFGVLPPPTIGGYSWSTTPTANQPFGGTITGTNFVSGIRFFLCVSGTATCFEHPSAGIALNSSTGLTVSNVNAGAGSYEFYLQTAAGQSGRSAPFAVQSAVPTIAGYNWSTTPTPSQPFGGTVTGTGFASGTRVFFCVNGTATCFEHPSAGITVNSSTTLTLNNVNLGAGAYQMYVQTSAGQSARSAAFTVQAPAATITGYNWNTTPTAGQFFGGTITGTGFIVSGTRVFFCASGTSTCYEHPQAGITVNSSTSLNVVNVNLGGGSWQLYVQTPAGQSARSAAFSVQSTPPPVVSAITPAVPSASGADQNITVTGSNFQQNLTVSVTFPGGGTATLSGTQIQSVTPTSFVMRITVGAPGAWVMRVNNLDGSQSSPFNFNVQSVVQPPSVFSLNPATPFAAGTDQDVVVSGSNFQQNLTVSATFPGGGGGTLSGAQIQNVTPSSFVLRITLGVPGAWSIRVNNPDGGQSAPFNFSVSPGAAGVTVTSLNPSSPTASGADQNVIVNGGGFQPGLRVNVTFPNGGVGTLQGSGQIQNVTANSFLMRITVNAPGAWLMRVVNPDGTQSGQHAFTVQPSGPTPTGLPTSVLSPVLGPLRVTTTNQGTRDGRWEFNQYKSGYHTPTGGISLSNDTYAWDVNLYTETSGNADAGKAVYAVADGEVVSYVGMPPGGGPGAVLIAHPNRTSPVWFSGYLHMTNVRVSLNQQVNPTTVLGDISRVGANNDHLHFVVYSGQNTRGNLRSFDVAITERSTLSASQPTISAISPPAVNQSSEPQTVTVSGANFLNPVIEVQDPNGQYFTITPEPSSSSVSSTAGIDSATDGSITARIPFTFSGTYTLSIINRESGVTAASVGVEGTSMQQGGVAFAASGPRKFEVYPAHRRAPVILIPGIMGSRLKKRVGGSLDEIFPALPYQDSAHVQLVDYVESGGPIKDRQVVATDIIDTVAGKDFYGTMIYSLAGPHRGYKLYRVDDPTDRTSEGCDESQKDANLFIFPYDWRSSNEQSARDLKDYVDCVRKIHDPNQSNPNFKVNIIAHSMGGLVARRYILEGLYGTSKYDPRVAKLVTLGTPWLGAPKFILALETGEVEGLSTGIFKLMHSSVLKNVARFMSGAHQLIPSPAYADRLKDKNVGDFPFGENGWDYNGSKRPERSYSFAELEALMNKRSPNGIILPGTNTKLFHEKRYLDKPLQDDWSGDQTGVTYYNFVGRSKGAYDTIGSVIATYEWYKDWKGVWKERWRLKPEMSRGDGTVPEISAMRQSNNGNYLGPALPKVFEDVNHSELPNNHRVLGTIDCLFAGGDSSNCLNTFSSTSVLLEQQAGGVPAYNLTVFGSQSVSIVDSFGNTTNPLSTSSDEGIATISAATTGGDFLSAVIPLDQSYKVLMRTSASPLVVAIMKNDGQVIMQAVRYQDLSVPPDVTALLELTPQGVSALKYDSDGDGTFEMTVNPTVSVTGTQAQDVEPPVVTFGETVQGGSSQVVLAATDAGTGVKQIMYSLDGSNYQPYTVPLALDPSRTPTVYAFADDNVANRSGLQTFQLSSGALRLDSVKPSAGRASGGQLIRLAGSFPGLSAVTVGGAAVGWSTDSVTGEVILTTPAHVPGAVAIELTPASGVPVSKANAFVYLPTTFTDDTLVPGVTVAKSQHVLELRQAVDALRAVTGLGPGQWTDPTLSPGATVIKPAHVTELRAYLEEAAARLGYTPGSYTDSSLGANDVIKRIHIEELRQRIRVIAN